MNLPVDRETSSTTVCSFVQMNAAKIVSKKNEFIEPTYICVCVKARKNLRQIGRFFLLLLSVSNIILNRSLCWIMEKSLTDSLLFLCILYGMDRMSSDLLASSLFCCLVDCFFFFDKDPVPGTGRFVKIRVWTIHKPVRCSFALTSSLRRFRVAINLDDIFCCFGGKMRFIVFYSL